MKIWQNTQNIDVKLTIFNTDNRKGYVQGNE